MSPSVRAFGSGILGTDCGLFAGNCSYILIGCVFGERSAAGRKGSKSPDDSQPVEGSQAADSVEELVDPPAKKSQIKATGTVEELVDPSAKKSKIKATGTVEELVDPPAKRSKSKATGTVEEAVGPAAKKPKIKATSTVEKHHEPPVPAPKRAARKPKAQPTDAVEEPSEPDMKVPKATAKKSKAKADLVEVLEDTVLEEEAPMLPSQSLPAAGSSATMEKLLMLSEFGGDSDNKEAFLDIVYGNPLRHVESDQSEIEYLRPYYEELDLFSIDDVSDAVAPDEAPPASPSSLQVAPDEAPPTTLSSLQEQMKIVQEKAKQKHLKDLHERFRRRPGSSATTATANPTSPGGWREPDLFKKNTRPFRSSMAMAPQPAEPETAAAILAEAVPDTTAPILAEAVPPTAAPILAEAVLPTAAPILAEAVPPTAASDQIEVSQTVSTAIAPAALLDSQWQDSQPRTPAEVPCTPPPLVRPPLLETPDALSDDQATVPGSPGLHCKALATRDGDSDDFMTDDEFGKELKAFVLIDETQDYEPAPISVAVKTEGVELAVPTSNSTSSESSLARAAAEPNDKADAPEGDEAEKDQVEDGVQNRSSKAGRAAYARMVRSIQGRQWAA